MYGLMNVRTCTLSADEKRHRRLHYCGTCKTIGRLYGQRARFLLNHDAVFLAETLSALEGTDAHLDEWQDAYHSYNCLRLPEGVDETPRALRYAAAATLLMTELKVADHCADSNHMKWRVARRIFENGFSKAVCEFTAACVSVDKIYGWGAVQNERERAFGSQPMQLSADEALTFLAEPTAVATGVVFGCGAHFVGCASAQYAVESLGRAFGELIYLLDAMADFQKDARSGEFNALRVAFGIEGERLPADVRRATIRRLRSVQCELADAIRRLPISETRKAAFIHRLDENLARKIGTPLPIVTRTCKTKPSQRLSFDKRWRGGVRIAQTLSEKFRRANATSPFLSVRSFFIFIGCLAAALLFPRYAHESQTYHDCFSLSFNVMALGSLFSGIGSFATLDRKERRRGEWCDAFDGCGDCACDGCCECISNIACDECCSSCDCCGSCDCGGCDCSC